MALTETLDIMMRSAASGVFAMLALLMARDYGWNKRPMLAMLAALSGAGYPICTYAAWPPEAAPIVLVAAPFCIMGPSLVWLFSLALFQDDFRFRPAYLAIAGLYLVLNQLNYGGLEMGQLAEHDTIFAVYSLLRLTLILHMLYVAWQGRDEDLLEPRRRFRMLYIIVIGAGISVIFITETFWQDRQLRGGIFSFWQALASLGVATTIFWHATSLKTSLLLNQSADLGSAHDVADIQALDVADKADLDAVEELMSEGKMYLEQSLTIARLADAARLPEHRLRRLINRHLGFRNFSDYLNSYRIEAAKLLLADRDSRNLPVLTIAMDLGYGSLGPFNRAFKERTGQTPTEYRRAALASA